MEPIRKIIILGGDVHAPMVAAAIANSLRGQAVEIMLLNGSPTAGGAHSALPQTMNFHTYLGIDHTELLRHTNATFKLGVDYTDWVEPGQHFLHPFGAHGATLRLVPFHHYFIQRQQVGDRHSLDSYSLAAVAAKRRKFAIPRAAEGSILPTFVNSVHVDAAQYAALFLDRAHRLGVNSQDGAVLGVTRRATDGFVESVTLEGERCIEGDLFIDCSGEPSWLLGDALEQDLLDWSAYLPCDRSISLSVADVSELSPLTFAVSKQLGWSRRIPMRDRSDYEFFYSSQHVDADAACETLRSDLGRAARGEPRYQKFRNGRRKRFWHKNCVAMGHSAGFIEPLENSNLQLAQSAVLRLMMLFPDRACDPALADEYNRKTALEYDNILDFVTLFYAAAKRSDSEFWRHCQTLQRPDTLRKRIELFLSHGRLAWHDEETFPKEYWVSALLGLGFLPASYDPLADVPGEVFILQWLEKMRGAIDAAERNMPTHEVFIEQALAAGSLPG